MKTKYMLFTWPESQAFIGRPECHLILPPENDIKGRLDSAYMVPEKTADAIAEQRHTQDLLPPLPEGDNLYEMIENSTIGDYLDYNGNTFIRAAPGGMFLGGEVTLNPECVNVIDKKTFKIIAKDLAEKGSVDYLVFTEDVFDDAIAIGIRKVNEKHSYAPVFTEGYDWLGAVGVKPDTQTQRFLCQNRNWLNPIIEHFGGDPIEANESQARFVARLKSATTGQYADRQYHEVTKLIHDKFVDKMNEIACRLYMNEHMKKSNGDTDEAFEWHLSLFGDSECFYEDYEACTEIQYHYFETDKESNAVIKTEKRSIYSISFCKDHFEIETVVDRGTRDDGGDMLTQRVSSANMTLGQIANIYVELSACVSNLQQLGR